MFVDLGLEIEGDKLDAVLDKVLDARRFTTCTIFTLPLNLKGLTGLPCRVVAEV